MSRTLEQKIADAEARLQRLKAKSRSLDTAQKVIVGAALLAKVRKPEEVQLRAWLLQFLKAEVTRQADVTRILPLINELEVLLKEAVIRATQQAPLRHNSVETFDEYNTGKNVGTGTPTIFWEIVPNSDELDLYTYMAGGGCSLPGKAMVLMPGAGYEGVTRFVLDVMTSYGLNACPPLLVGVGVGTSVEVAALHAKKALMRPIGSHNPNKNAALLEQLLEDGINKIGLGPQGLGGKYSVMGVNVENSARHPSVIGVAVNVGCWSHRRGHIVFDKNLNYKILSHSGVTL